MANDGVKLDDGAAWVATLNRIKGLYDTAGETAPYNAIDTSHVASGSKFDASDLKEISDAIEELKKDSLVASTSQLDATKHTSVEFNAFPNNTAYASVGNIASKNNQWSPTNSVWVALDKIKCINTAGCNLSYTAYHKTSYSYSYTAYKQVSYTAGGTGYGSGTGYGGSGCNVLNYNYTNYFYCHPLSGCYKTASQTCYYVCNDPIGDTIYSYTYYYSYYYTYTAYKSEGYTATASGGCDKEAYTQSCDPYTYHNDILCANTTWGGN